MNFKNNLKKLLAITRWELSKVFSDWKRTLVVFLLPALLMVVFLLIFPSLINYMSTGALGKTNIFIINAPDSFITYYEGIEGRTAFKYTFISDDEASQLSNNKDYEKKMRQGAISLTFSDNFDSDVRNYYELIGTTLDSSIVSNASIDISYDDRFNVETRVEQFEELVIDDYSSQIPEILNINTADYSCSYINIDSFNPIGKLLYNRTVANSGAARIIPQVMVLLLYYTIYSLSMDSFLGDKERGFFTKLKMAPVGTRMIVFGKMLAIVIISVLSSCLSFLMMFIVSWTNYSNDSMSLIPLGLFLVPSELLMLLLSIISLSILFCSFAVLVVFSLEKTADITINLQMPLVLILLELFMLFMLGGNSLGGDYLIPVHGTIIAISDIFKATGTIQREITMLIVNFITTAIILFKAFKKEELQ